MITKTVPGDRYVPWIGECKEDWHFKPIKYLCGLNSKILPENTPSETEILYIDIGNVNSDGTYTVSDPMLFGEAPSRARRLLVDGDVLVSTVRTYLRAITHMDKVDGNLVCSTGFAVLTAREGVVPRFLAYWVRSAYFVDEIVARSEGVSYPAINSSDVAGLPFPVIPLGKQRAIADFLDRETERIDTLLAKKERQIELLREKRSALISHLVTKGLDPDVKMKDSGVAWLGRIPDHWTIKQLKWVVVFQRGHDLPTDDREDGEVPVVTSSGISSTHSKAVAKAPGIVTGRYGTIGHFHLIEQDYWPLNTTLYSIELYDNIPRFLQYMLSHMSPLFLLNAVKSAVPGVDRNDIHPIKTAVPPTPEQRAIAAFLDKETSRIDALIGRVGEAIERLKEYRTALISAAVTGKIDVREEVA